MPPGRDTRGTDAPSLSFRVTGDGDTTESISMHRIMRMVVQMD